MRGWAMRGWTGALSAVLMWAAPAGASAQEAARQARGYLEAGIAAHAEHGYAVERTVPELVVPLELDSAYVWSVYLREGMNYRVYGACDNYCSDLDMEIYAADGLLADRDIATDDTPFVQITPTQTGRAYVRLWLYACSTEPCTIAARVVSGGMPAPRQTPPRQEGPAQVVRAELDAAGARHLEAGYASFGEDVTEALTLQSGGHRFSVRLGAGASYVFQGACDQDCSDVDMEILDRYGAQAAVDVTGSDRPLVAVSPAHSGEYTIRIWLAQCSVEPCTVGVRGFERR